MLDITQEERKVLIFLMAVALAGAGASYAVKVNSAVRHIVHLDEDFGKVDLNSADEELLKSVPGIGEKIARRIVELRSENAGFSDLEQLKDIKGITSARFNKLKNYLVVR
jgi:competence protein ComEA